MKETGDCISGETFRKNADSRAGRREVPGSEKHKEVPDYKLWIRLQTDQRAEIFGAGAVHHQRKSELCRAVERMGQF